MLIKFFLIAQRPSRATEKSLRYWREQTEFITCACATHWRRQYELHFSLAGQVGMAMHLGEQDSNCESLVVSQNFVLCQDGLTPCHLMLSLSGCHRLRVKSAVEINMSNLDPSSQCASLPYEPLLAKVNIPSLFHAKHFVDCFQEKVVQA
ncbi:uncharacterized protein [Dermacentor andersoni]|uniref:uncharacterized protein isoform X1 n=1 Tax=Dermacentor andersoni TaxID=34620 RepID=UPI003B3AB15B